MTKYVISDSNTGLHHFTKDCEDMAEAIDIAENHIGIAPADYSILDKEAFKLSPTGVAFFAGIKSDIWDSEVKIRTGRLISAANVAPGIYNNLTGPEQTELDAYVVALQALRTGYVGDPDLMVLPVKPVFI